MRLKDLLALDDIPTILKKAITVMDKEINRMARHIEQHEPLQAADAKALVAYTTCLVQTNKDHRLTKHDLEAQMATMTEEQLLALAKANPILTDMEIETETPAPAASADAQLRALLKGNQ